MKKLSYLTLLLFLLSTPFSSKAQMEPKSQDESEIITTFANYKYGFEQFKPEYILKNVSASTVRFFDSVLYHIQYSDSTIVSALPVSQMVLVLDIRKKAYSKAAVAKNATQLLDIILNYGIIREDQTLQIANIFIQDSVAHCAALSPSSPKPKNYAFIKENDFWKIDLNALYIESDRNFANLLNNQELMSKYQFTKSSLMKQILSKYNIPDGSSEAWIPTQVGYPLKKESAPAGKP